MSTTDAQPVTFPIDLSDQGFLAGDRTEAYRRLRDTGTAVPLALGPGDPAQVVSNYTDVRAILRLPEGRVQPRGTVAPPWLEGVALDRLRANLVQIDKPDHTRLRNVVGPMFIPRRVEQFREFAADSVARAIANVRAQGGTADAVQDLGVDIPRGVICRFLGIPEEDWGRLTENQHAFLLIFSPAPLDQDQMGALNGITKFYLDYFENFLASRPRVEHSPFVQLLLDAEQAGDSATSRPSRWCTRSWTRGTRPRAPPSRTWSSCSASSPSCSSSCGPTPASCRPRWKSPSGSARRCTSESATWSRTSRRPTALSSRPARGPSSWSPPPIATRRSSPIPTGSTSAGPTPATTWPSAAGCTTASVPRSRASSCRRPCAASSTPSSPWSSSNPDSDSRI